MPRSLLLLPLLTACHGTTADAPETTTDPPESTSSDTVPDTTQERPPSRLDAVHQWPGDRSYFYQGSDYIRFDSAIGEADDGYPLDIATYWPGVGVPVDAAALMNDEAVTFFAGGDVVVYSVIDDAPVGSPMSLDSAFPGVGIESIEAAALYGDTLSLFRGGELTRFDMVSLAVSTEPLDSALPGIWADGVDAALQEGTQLHLFRGEEFRTFDLEQQVVVDEGPFVFAWPGLWDPHEGTGDPSANLPGDVEALLADDPSPAEVDARKERVRQSAANTDYIDLSSDYPVYLASIEDYLGVWGCLLLYDPTRDTHRFRCATDTAGVGALDIEPLQTEWIDWSRAAFHVDQVSQGDFIADAGTPLSIHRADDGVFTVTSVTGNSPSGSISGGLNVQVRFLLDGVERTIGFSHLNTSVPQYVLDAETSGEALPVGTAFGFVGYTGNLWIAAPPAVDGPYTGSGEGLPVAHSHLWFADDLDNHMALTRWIREAIDFSGRYPYGGG